MDKWDFLRAIEIPSERGAIYTCKYECMCAKACIEESDAQRHCLPGGKERECTDDRVHPPGQRRRRRLRRWALPLTPSRFFTTLYKPCIYTYIYVPSISHQERVFTKRRLLILAVRPRASRSIVDIKRDSNADYCVNTRVTTYISMHYVHRICDLYRGNKSLKKDWFIVYVYVSENFLFFRISIISRREQSVSCMYSDVSYSRFYIYGVRSTHIAR